MNKRGEPTFTFYLITTILIVIGLGIVLLVIFKIDFPGEIDDNTCRLSVLSRATGPESTNTFIPLLCETKKFCLTDKLIGGKCDELAGEKNVNTVRLIGSSGSKAKKIEEITAREMYNCWQIMGEGKLSLFSGGFLEEFGLDVDGMTNPTCVFCSRIALDINKNKGEILNQINLKEHMGKNKAPNGLTYLQAFAADQSVNAYPLIPEQNIYSEFEEAVGEVKQINSKQGNDEIVVVFSQMASKNYGDVLESLGKTGAVVVGSLFVSPAGRLAANVPVAIAGIGTAAGITAYSMANVWQGRTATAGYCGNLITNAGGQGQKVDEGCSGVQVLPYEYSSLKGICTFIEGNP